MRPYHERLLLAWSGPIVLLASLGGLHVWIAAFPLVWTSTLWADVVFVAGVLMAQVWGLRVGVDRHPLLGFLSAAVGTAVTFPVAFMLAWGGMERGLDGFLVFAAPEPAFAAGLAINVGWPGVLAMGLLSMGWSMWARADVRSGRAAARDGAAPA